jgi:hypothetical protein
MFHYPPTPALAVAGAAFRSQSCACSISLYAMAGPFRAGVIFRWCQSCVFGLLRCHGWNPSHAFGLWFHALHPTRSISNARAAWRPSKLCFVWNSTWNSRFGSAGGLRDSCAAAQISLHSHKYKGKHQHHVNLLCCHQFSSTSLTRPSTAME